MSKVVTGLKSNPVTTHEIINRITKGDYEEYINTDEIVRNYLLKDGYILDVDYETAFRKVD